MSKNFHEKNVLNLLKKCLIIYTKKMSKNVHEKMSKNLYKNV